MANDDTSHAVDTAHDHDAADDGVPVLDDPVDAFDHIGVAAHDSDAPTGGTSTTTIVFPFPTTTTTTTFGGPLSPTPADPVNDTGPDEEVAPPAEQPAPARSPPRLTPQPGPPQPEAQPPPASLERTALVTPGWSPADRPPHSEEPAPADATPAGGADPGPDIALVQRFERAVTTLRLAAAAAVSRAVSDRRSFGGSVAPIEPEPDGGPGNDASTRSDAGPARSPEAAAPAPGRSSAPPVVGDTGRPSLAWPLVLGATSVVLIGAPLVAKRLRRRSAG